VRRPFDDMAHARAALEERVPDMDEPMPGPQDAEEGP